MFDSKHLTTPRVLLVAGAVAVLAVSAYLWQKTSPQVLPVVPATAAMWKLPSAMNAAAPTSNPAPQANTAGDIAGMAERLAARLKKQPNDAQGWAILARSYDVMGQLPDALMAYKKASTLLPDDQALLADYAKAVARANQGNGSAANAGAVPRQ